MIDNDQSTIIEAPEVYKSIPTHSPTATPTTECTREKNVDFDTFDGHVMVNYIEPNLQEFIFGPIRVGLITQKQFWDHLKNCHSWGRTPYYCCEPDVLPSCTPCQENLPPRMKRLLFSRRSSLVLDTDPDSLTSCFPPALPRLPS